MFYTYILKSDKKYSYYIGSCQNLKKRVSLHNKGLVRSTKSALPWSLVYAEKFETRKEARGREMAIKRLKSRKSIERIFLNFKIENPR